MPRYRFRWEAISSGLIRRLAADAGIDGDPSEGLRRRYGARPGPDFVKEHWPLLRDRWLASDSSARRGVIAALKERRLGDWEMPTRRRSDELAYMASCRNTAGLREVVLDAFHDLGDIGRGATAPPGVQRPAGVPVVAPSAGVDIDHATQAAWEDFEGRLARMLTTLGEDQYVVIEVAPPHAAEELEGASRFVQFAGQGDAGLRAEVSSNSFLDKQYQLDDLRQARLRSLGWHPPTGSPDEATPQRDPSGSPNYFRDFPAPVSGEPVARMTVATLRDALDVPHPSVLVAAGFAGEDNVSPPILDLGIPVLAQQPTQPARGVALNPKSVEELRRMVDDALAPSFGGKVQHDPDGNIPVRAGSAMVFVRAAEDAPVVELFAPLLLEVDASASLMTRLGELNNSLRFARLSWQNRTVLASMQLFAGPFVPEHLQAALGVMSRIADEVDDELQAEFGGRLFFGEFRPPPEDRDRGTGGYL